MENQTGSLQIQVYENTIINPLADVQITVRQEDTVIATMTTNALGESEIITLETPPLLTALSEVSGQPFATYQVSVEKENYQRVIVNNVQIYADQLARQRIFLLPTTRPELQIITIQEPTLSGDYEAKIPEDEVKALPPASGFVVLDEVVIPEYMVVHEGRPDAAGPNYTVPFKDYIKNVACCEIYATWPRETIIANIYAILSFSLNRVYTEWYRSRGYPFTITSATSHDHAYSHGRTIYENISEIVDDVFDSYVSRPGIRQPLFTQYCDGRSSSCPTWLRQWESMDLGVEGRSALEILQFFYGNDIYIEQAQRVSGIPESFGGQDLALGSSGTAVRTIQEQLNVIATHYPLIPRLRVDGIYGNATADSVEVFQEVFNLPVTGIVDKRTWYQISQIYVAVSRMTQR